MSIGLKVSGDWKDVSAVSVKVSGAWKTVSQAYVKVSGTWEELLGGSVPFSVAYTDSTSTTVSASSHTFTGRAIGAASSTRLVVVAIHWSVSGSTNVTGVTIGGVTATQLCQSDGTNVGVAFYAAVVPTGTTADIAITWGASIVRGGVGVFTVDGYASATPHDFHAPAGGTDASRNATLDSPAGGGIIAACVSTTAGITWTNVTEQYDFSITDIRASGGFEENVSALSGQVVTAANCRVINAVSFG